jgi:hypothetical protein
MKILISALAIATILASSVQAETTPAQLKLLLIKNATGQLNKAPVVSKRPVVKTAPAQDQPTASSRPSGR